MGESGFREYGPTVEEDVEDSIEDAEVEELVESLRDDLSFVYDNPDNGQRLDDILKLIENHYE